MSEKTMLACFAANAISVTAVGVAVSIACYVTKSAWPLLGFILVPRNTFERSSVKEDNTDGKKEVSDS